MPPATDAAVASRTARGGGDKHCACARCGVVIRWMPGHEKRRGLPVGWAKERGQTYCLGCRRERAAEAGIAAAGDSVSLTEKAKLRTQAIVEFELRRDPERPNGEIAKVARCSIPAVAKVRRRVEQGE